MSTAALWLAAASASAGWFNVTRLTNVTGYFFEKVCDVKYRTGTHRLDLIVGLASYADGVDRANDIRRRANSMCLNATGSRAACDDLERSLNASCARLEDTLEEFARVRAQLRGRPAARGRRRRADVASAVLGKLMFADGATADDLRWMNGRLEAKHRAASALTDRLAETVESIAVYSAADARAVGENFGKVNDTFRRLGDRLRDWAEAERDRQLDAFASRFAELARRLGEVARDLTDAARWPRDALLRWADPAGVGETLARIGARPAKTLPVNASAESQVRRLLDVVDVRTRFDEGDAPQLRFEVDVPLVFDEPFTLYRLHPVPRTVRRPDGTAARVRMRGDGYLAVTADFGHYVGFTGRQVAADCRRLDDAFRLCDGRRTVRARTDDAGAWSCEYAQAVNVATAAAAACANDSLEVRDRAEFVRLDAVNVWLYWVDRPTALNVTCDAPDRRSSSTRYLLQDGAGLLSLADRCGADAASGHRLITDTVNATSHRLHQLFSHRRFAAPNVTTYLDVPSATSRLRSVAHVHATFPVLEPTPSDWSAAVNGARDVSHVVGRYRTEEEEEPSSSGNPRLSGGANSFAELSWQWYAAAAITAYLLVHMAVKCARKKLLRCALGKSNAKKLKIQRKIIEPHCGE